MVGVIQPYSFLSALENPTLQGLCNHVIPPRSGMGYGVQFLVWVSFDIPCSACHDIVCSSAPNISSSDVDSDSQRRRTYV